MQITERTMRRPVRNARRELVGNASVTITPATEYAHIYLKYENGDERCIGTLQRKRATDRSNRKEWEVYATDGTLIHADNFVTFCMSAMIREYEHRLVLEDSAFLAFQSHMLVTALWAESDDEGAQLQDNFDVSDIDEASMRKLQDDAVSFYRRNVLLIHAHNAPLANDMEGTTVERQAAMAGHDFWLTRNGHGAGFWDGDWPNGDTLTDKAKTYGEANLYVGDDGKLYI